MAQQPYAELPRIPILVGSHQSITRCGCTTGSASVFGTLRTLLAERGINVTYETVRQCCLNRHHRATPTESASCDPILPQALENTGRHPSLPDNRVVFRTMCKNRLSEASGHAKRLINQIGLTHKELDHDHSEQA